MKQIRRAITELRPQECWQGQSKVKVIAEGQGHWNDECALRALGIR